MLVMFGRLVIRTTRNWSIRKGEELERWQCRANSALLRVHFGSIICGANPRLRLHSGISSLLAV